MMSSDFLHPSWRFSSDLVGSSKQRTRNRLKMLASRKTMLDTCSTEKGLNASFYVEQIKDRPET